MQLFWKTSVPMSQGQINSKVMKQSLFCSFFLACCHRISLKMWCDVKISTCYNGGLYLQFYESWNKAFYYNMNQLRKHVTGPQVQIIPLEIIIHPFQSIVCLIIQTLSNPVRKYPMLKYNYG